VYLKPHGHAPAALRGEPGEEPSTALERSGSLEGRNAQDNMATEQFCLRWNDFHSNITSAFSEIRDDDDFMDVTLVCDGDIVQAHKLVLSACSPLFRIMLKKNSHPQPMIFLRGIRYPDMVAILNFMYHGEVNVNQEDLQLFLAAAEELRIKGLSQASSWPDKSDNNQVPKKKTNSGGSSTGQPPAKRPRPMEQSSPGVSPLSTPVSAKSPAPEEDDLPPHDPPQLSVKPEFSSKELGLIAEAERDREDGNSSNNGGSNQLLDSIAAVQNFAFGGPGFDQTSIAQHSVAAYSSSPQHLMPGHGAGSLPNTPNDASKGLLQFLGQNNVSSAAANAIMMQRLLGHGYELHPLGSRKDNDPLAHIKVARSSKGWHCPQCIHISSTKGNLKSHIIAGRHKVYTEKPFGCQYCDRSYGTKQSLQVHISTNHRAERDAEYQALSKSLGMKSFPESPNMSPSPLNSHNRSSPQHIMNPLKTMANHLNINMNMNFEHLKEQNFVEQMKEVNNINNSNNLEDESEELTPLMDQEHGHDLVNSLTPQAAIDGEHGHHIQDLPVIANVDTEMENGVGIQ
jgi:hypothetical protein